VPAGTSVSVKLPLPSIVVDTPVPTIVTVNAPDALLASGTAHTASASG
jgi:hypothetical protein